MKWSNNIDNAFFLFQIIFIRRIYLALWKIVHSNRIVLFRSLHKILSIIETFFIKDEYDNLISYYSYSYTNKKVWVNLLEICLIIDDNFQQVCLIRLTSGNDFNRKNEIAWLQISEILQILLQLILWSERIEKFMFFLKFLLFSWKDEKKTAFDHCNCKCFPSKGSFIA